MHSKIAPIEDTMVSLASIAAELHSVMDVAWSVSLAAKNAKVISAQSGDDALGFQPITDFIDEISQLAMKGVEDINNEALRLTKIAVNERRIVDAFKRFDSVIQKDAGALHLSSVLPAIQQVENNMNISTREFKASILLLSQMLESMDECMLSARAIASVSRIVTATTKEYKDKLLVVANDLDKAAVYIKKKLSDSYVHLENVKIATR